MSSIDKSIDMSKYHLFKNNKSIIQDDSIAGLKKTLKELAKPPKSNKKVFVVNFSLDLNKKEPLKVLCAQYTITPKLALVMKDDDISQTVTWNMDELKKYGFKKQHINKIIKAISNDLISHQDSSVSITDVLDSL